MTSDFPPWADSARKKLERLSLRTARDTVSQGRILVRARPRFEYGRWEAWVGTLPFSLATALRLTRIGAVFGQVKSVTVTFFEVAALYDLAVPSCPIAVRDHCLTLAAAGTRVTDAMVSELLFDAHQARDPNEPRTYGRGEPTEAVLVVRGAIIAAMDKSFESGPAGRLLWQHPDEPATPDERRFITALRDAATETAAREILWRYGKDVFQALVVELFPEAYLDPAEQTHEGVIPNAGPRRVGAKRLEEVAATIGAKGG